MIGDHLFEDIPDDLVDALDDPFRALDVVGVALLDELPHDERLEQLQGHLLRQAALVELELRPDDDDRAAGVVHPLTQEVLAEPALLALEHVAQRLEAVIAGPRDRPAAPAVVDQRVAGLLEHPLLVADDDLRGAQLEESLEAVVAVDDPPVEVVEVGRGEAPAVELDHRAQVGRDDRQDGQDHPLRPRAGAAEGLDETEPLDRLLAALTGGRPDLHVELPGELLELHPGDDLADGLRAHPGPEEPAAPGPRAVPLVEVPEVGLGEGEHRLERLDLVALATDLVLEPFRLALAGVAQGVDRGLHGDPEVLDLLLGGPPLVGLADPEPLRDALRLGDDDLLELRQSRFAALLARGDHDLAGRGEGDGHLGDSGLQRGDAGLGGLRRLADLLGLVLAALFLVGQQLPVGGLELVPATVEGRALLLLGLVGLRVPAAALGLVGQVREGAPARLLVDVSDDEEREVEDPLEVAGTYVEEDAEPGRRPLEVPDVADRAGQLDVTHPLAADLRPGDLHPALVADDALVADPLVLPAVALPVLRGTEDALVEEAVLLRLEGPVVDRLRLCDLPGRPVADLVRARERDADRVEVVDLEHRSPRRRRLASAARCGSGRAEPSRPGTGSAGGGPGVSPRTRRG